MDWQKLIGLKGKSLGGQEGSTGLGPDFPDSSGDRERGKFRESEYPRLVTVAVVDDDGRPVGTVLVPNFEELASEIRKLRLALQLNGVAADLGDF